MTNTIREIVRSRLAALVKLSDGAAHVPHAVTKGQLRESYLIEFFRELIPAGLRIRSGIVCDALGQSSKQLDLIVIDPSFLPALTLSGDVAIVPLESTLLFAEIKSRIDVSTLDQLSEQIDSVIKLSPKRLKVSSQMDFSMNNFLVPSIILGYESALSPESMIERLSKMDPEANLIGACVIGKFSVLRTGPQTFRTITSSDASPFVESLEFVGLLYQTLNEVCSLRRGFQADWLTYMRGLQT